MLARRPPSLAAAVLLALAHRPAGTSAFAFLTHRAGGVGVGVGTAAGGGVPSLRMVVEIGPTDDDVDPPLPGQMKISEIKSVRLALYLARRLCSMGL